MSKIRYLLSRLLAPIKSLVRAGDELLASIQYLFFTVVTDGGSFIRFFLSRLLSPIESLRSTLTKLDAREAFQSFPAFELTGILPVIGYGLLFVSFGDFLNTLLPLQLRNPLWELQTVDSIVNQTWAFLIGIGFICTRYFSENRVDVRVIEIYLLRVLRWLLFVMAIVYLLLLPLMLLNSSRVSKVMTQQFTLEQNTKNAQIAQVEAQKANITNLDQLRQLGQSVGIDPDELRGASESQLRTGIDRQLSVLKSQINEQSAIALREKLRKITQSCARTIYTQILQIIIFFFIWFKIGRGCKTF